MAQCTVSGIVKDLSETAVAGVMVKASIMSAFFTTTVHIVPVVLSTTTAAGGTWSLNLLQGSSALVSFEYPPNSSSAKQKVQYSVLVPATATANFSTLVTET